MLVELKLKKKLFSEEFTVERKCKVRREYRNVSPTYSCCSLIDFPPFARRISLDGRLENNCG